MRDRNCDVGIRLGIKPAKIVRHGLADGGGMAEARNQHGLATRYNSTVCGGRNAARVVHEANPVQV